VVKQLPCHAALVGAVLVPADADNGCNLRATSQTRRNVLCRNELDVSRPGPESVASVQPCNRWAQHLAKRHSPRMLPVRGRHTVVVGWDPQAAGFASCEESCILRGFGVSSGGGRLSVFVRCCVDATPVEAAQHLGWRFNLERRRVRFRLERASGAEGW